MVGSARRNLNSALDTACGLGCGSKYRENTGAMSVMFSVMIIPEIWKNRSFSAVEIEKQHSIHCAGSVLQGYCCFQWWIYL